MSGSEFGRFAGWRAVDDLGVDLDDATEAPLLHPGSTRTGEQHRPLDEEVELRDVVLPGDLGKRRLRLRTRGVEHQHVDLAQAASHRGHELDRLALVGDVGVKASATPPSARIARATSSAPLPPCTSLTVTARPSRPRRRAIALPSPREDPSRERRAPVPEAPVRWCR